MLSICLPEPSKGAPPNHCSSELRSGSPTPKVAWLAGIPKQSSITTKKSHTMDSIKKISSIHLDLDKPKRRKRDRSRLDDTPKGFKRLMALQQGIKPRSGLDDGNMPSRKRKCSQFSEATTSSSNLGHLQSRLNREDPHKYLLHKSAKHVPTSKFPKPDDTGSVLSEFAQVKAPLTRKERKLQKIRDEWRRAEAARKAEAEEAQEEAKEQDPCADFWQSLRGSRKGSSKKSRGEQEPLIKKRNPRAAPPTNRQSQDMKGLIGLHDVVKEPPHFSHLPKKRLRGGDFD